MSPFADEYFKYHRHKIMGCFLAPVQNLDQSNLLSQKRLETFTREWVCFWYLTGCGICLIVGEMITNPSQETGHTGKGCSAVNMPHYWKIWLKEGDVIIHRWEGRQKRRKRQRSHICFSVEEPIINIRLDGDGGSVRDV